MVPPPRRLRRRRTAAGGAALALLGAILWTAHGIGGDPLEAVLRARGRLAGLVEGPTLVRGGSLVRELRLASTSGLEVRLEVVVPAGGARPLPLRLSCGEAVVPASGEAEGAGGRVEARLVEPSPAGGDDPEGVCEVAAALVLAVDALVPLAEVDRAAIELAGLGPGVAPAVLAAAVDSRPAALLLVPSPEAARPPAFARFGARRADDPPAFLPRVLPRPVRVLGEGPLARSLRAAISSGP